MNRTAWIIIAALTIVGLGALIISQKKEAVDVSNVNAYAINTGSETLLADRVYGKKDAKVVLIEYGDFQCPGCQGAYTNLDPVLTKYKDKIAFVFRNFPLTQSHPNALAASSFAEAAGQQGKYWEAYHLLFGKRDAWVNLSVNQRDEQFNTFAKELGLDDIRLKTDMLSKLVAKKITYDQALGEKSNVTATPSYFLQGKKLDDTTVTELIQSGSTKLEVELNNALKAAGETPLQ